MTSARIPLFAATIAFALAASPYALAQTPEAQEQQPPPAQGAPAEQPQQPSVQTAPDLSQEELKTYAVAALEVQKVNQSYQPAIQEAESNEEKKAIFDKAMEQMVGIVRDKGLTVEKYNQITAVMEANPEVAQQVQGYMTEGQ